ncbi:MAG: acyl-CoA dehydrogenase [Acidobacteria bacterium]|nr:acyl-CoA dehydrogenase [Acidobacteriota bacterium]
MPLAITDEHRELATVARSFAERHDALGAARQLLDAPDEALPDLWKELAALGWLGLHLPEEHGGQGYGLAETAVVVEELGRAVTPGPFLSTVIASAVIATAGDDALRKAWLPGLADGSVIGAIGFGSLALGAGQADVLVIADGEDMVVLTRDEATVTLRRNLDLTRRVAEVTVPAGAGTRLAGARSGALAIARALAAAEAAGIAHACTDMAAGYAKVREQFGRVIGSFMAVKHLCANMKVQAELSTAAAWDAARAVDQGGDEGALAAAIAASVSLPAATFCAETNIQVHGGIGYTWEHDAHLYMRRAGALLSLFGPADAARDDVFRLAAAGVTRNVGVDLPPEAETYRAEVRTFLDGFTDLDPAEQRRRLVDEGYLNPHWPKPWGRAAGAVEQLVIEQEFAGVPRPEMGIGGWVTLTFTQHGSPDQVERWTRPSLLGQTQWCQLFSEPNAGSDAAGIRTRAVKVAGGWTVNGQKLWTSGAQHCTHGFATVRTDPDAPKHDGITMMAIDLKGPGVTIRPLRSIAGHAGFNEVFFDDVFVPDDDVVGPVNGGWAVARATLGNERVTIGAGGVAARMINAGALVPLANRHRPGDSGTARRVGALVAEGQAMRLINVRTVARAVLGVEPSPEGNVTKLLNSEHGQRVAELAMAVAGEHAAVADGDDGEIGPRWISIRSLSIAGGTSEIARNQIGERLLGLPREPLLK